MWGHCYVVGHYAVQLDTKVHSARDNVGHSFATRYLHHLEAHVEFMHARASAMLKVSCAAGHLNEVSIGMTHGTKEYAYEVKAQGIGMIVERVYVPIITRHRTVAVNVLRLEVLAQTDQSEYISNGFTFMKDKNLAVAFPTVQSQLWTLDS